MSDEGLVSAINRADPVGDIVRRREIAIKTEYGAVDYLHSAISASTKGMRPGTPKREDASTRMCNLPAHGAEGNSSKREFRIPEHT